MLVGAAVSGGSEGGSRRGRWECGCDCRKLSLKREEFLVKFIKEDGSVPSLDGVINFFIRAIKAMENLQGEVFIINGDTHQSKSIDMNFDALHEVGDEFRSLNRIGNLSLELQDTTSTGRSVGLCKSSPSIK